MSKGSGMWGVCLLLIIVFVIMGEGSMPFTGLGRPHSDSVMELEHSQHESPHGARCQSDEAFDHTSAFQVRPCMTNWSVGTVHACRQASWQGGTCQENR